ncbi:type II toxin-antitoxin system RelE/ParE family toxin [Rhodopila sp.]|uniref:type II toxin-antitoxin system RelE/ParE family toxin n=1 Tax=Rhodopila sp. TaxID=2480087 RepID=UPI003D14CD06
MTSGTSIDIKEVIFINQRCEKDYLLLPREVGETADGALDALQNGRTPSGNMYGPMTNDRRLTGIWEIKLPYDGDAFRVYVWLGCQQVVFVLDAGDKKSPSGKEVPEWQKDRLAERLANAKRDSESLAAELWDAFNARAKRRARLQRSGVHG